MMDKDQSEEITRLNKQIRDIVNAAQSEYDSCKYRAKRSDSEFEKGAWKGAEWMLKAIKRVTGDNLYDRL
jgi:hypothetical protein